MSIWKRRQDEEMSSIGTEDGLAQRDSREQKAQGPCSDRDGERCEEVWWEEWVTLGQFTQGFEFPQRGGESTHSESGRPRTPSFKRQGRIQYSLSLSKEKWLQKLAQHKGKHWVPHVVLRIPTSYGPGYLGLIEEMTPLVVCYLLGVRGELAVHRGQKCGQWQQLWYHPIARKSAFLHPKKAQLPFDISIS